MTLYSAFALLLALAAGFGYLNHRFLRLPATIGLMVLSLLLSLVLVGLGKADVGGVLRTSGPLAMVVAGLLIGNCARNGTMSNTSLDYVHKFWELTDRVLNVLLFALIGL